MAKEKKIGFGYFLNKRLKSLPLPGLEEQERHPPYVQISFLGKTTKMPFGLLYIDGYVTEEEFQIFFIDQVNESIKEDIKNFEVEIEKILRFEYKQLGEKVSLKGLSNRISFYTHLYLWREIEKYAMKRLSQFVSQQTGKTDNAYYDDTFHFSEVYYLIEDNLLPNLKDILPADLKRCITVFANFPDFDDTGLVAKEKGLRVIDWLDENVRTAFKEFCLFGKHKMNGYKYESKKSPALRLYNEFPIEPLETANYLRIIDKAIIESAK